MLPLTLLKAAEDQEILIELKNGDTYSGTLVSCNMFMNITVREVTRTNKDGDKFWNMPECFIRGNSIKYLQIPDQIITTVAEQEIEQRKAFRGGRGGGRGGGGRGRGDGRGGRGEGRGRGGDGRGRGRGGRGGPASSSD